MPEDEPLDDSTAIQLLKLATAYNLEKPSQKSESTHVHITLEQRQQSEEAERAP